MNRIEIPDRNLSFNMPEHLGECNSEEYAGMCKLLFEYQSGKIDLQQLRQRAVYVLLNLRPSKKESPEEIEEQKNANIYQLSELVDSFFTKNEDSKLAIRQEYQNNHSPVIDCGTLKYHGPQDYLKSATFGEYVDGLNIFSAFNQSGSVDLLYNLCGVFYRKKGKKYNPDKIEHISKKLKFADFGQIFGFYMFFASFQHYLTNATVYWEGRELDLSILFKNTSPDAPTSSLPSLGMKATSYMLAESGVLGNLEAVNNTNIWEVLLLMYDIKKSDIDNQQKQKK